MLIIESENMQLNWLEDKLIRMPKELREKISVTLGEFVKFENNIILQVDHAYEKDIKKYGNNTAFVTSTTAPTLINTNPTVVNTLTMGCDPELYIINKVSGNLVDPKHLFNKWDAIGTDGLLCELRPLPHVDVDKVANTLHSMLTTIQQKYTSLGLHDLMSYGSSYAFGITAGFHCHMGIPKNFLDKRAPNYQKFIDIMVRALDYHVGVLSIIQEGTEENQRRCAPFLSYGKVSDYRIDNRTLEYRVPGGTLLKSPELTRGLMSICSVVTTDAIARIKSFTNDFKIKKIPDNETFLKELYGNLPDIPQLFRLICSPDVISAQAEAPSIFNSIKNMNNYVNQKSNIDTFKKVITTKIPNDIWYNWDNKRG